MKKFLVFLLVVICLYQAKAQIIFEEIDPPVEFNVDFVSASPIGEMFLMESGNSENIYSSFDGETWNIEILPEDIYSPEMIFFDDGTPLMFSRTGGTLIRTESEWEILNPLQIDFWDDVEYAQIINDTLYFYQDSNIYYSTDKGETYTLWLDLDVFVHSVKFYVYDSTTVFHYTIGASDYFQIYIDDILVDEFETGTYDKILNIRTDEVIIIFNDNYIHFDLDIGSWKYKELSSLFPDYNYNDEYFNTNDYFYRVTETAILRAQSFEGLWEEYKSLPSERTDNFYVGYNEDVYGYNWNGYYLNISKQNSTDWESLELEMSTPIVRTFLESENGLQALLSNNFLYRRNENSNWTRDESIVDDITKIEFGDKDELFVTTKNGILYSKDGSQDYSTINLPDTELSLTNSYGLFVLKNQTLVFIDYYGFPEQIYYSTDNGVNWDDADFENIISGSYGVNLNLVNNEIFIVSNDYRIEEFRINLETGETSEETYQDYTSYNSTFSMILDNGEILFDSHVPDNYYSLSDYLISHDPYTGSFDTIMNAAIFQYSTTRVGIDNAMYAFSSDIYRVLEYGELTTGECIGLPSQSSFNGRLAKSGNVVIIGGFRSLFVSSQQLHFPNTLEGSISFDENKNCIIDNEVDLSSWEVSIEGDGYSKKVFSNSDGQYSTTLPVGEYSVTSSVPNDFWDLCNDTEQITIENEQTTEVNFLAQALEDCGIIVLDFSTPFIRRCFDNRYSFTLENKGTIPLNDVDITIEMDEFYSVLGASLPYTIDVNNVVNIKIDKLDVFEELRFYIEFNLSCEAELGQQHCIDANVTANPLCGSGSSRPSATDCQENIGSFDPNDKRCFNEEGFESDLVDLDEYFYYHIRFQNTGTDTAFNIRVVDPISEKLDLSTFEMLSSSHENEYLISDGPHLEVYFDNILLPDSTTNLVGSNGYFKFRIKPLAEYAYGESFENQAAIYFDFNEPIYTNTTETILGIPTSTEDIKEIIQVDINPNPTQDIFTLTLESKDSGSSQISIYNDRGQLMTTLSSNEQQIQFDSSHYPVGVYVVKVQVGDEVVSRKLVVL